MIYISIIKPPNLVIVYGCLFVLWDIVVLYH